MQQAFFAGLPLICANQRSNAGEKQEKDDSCISFLLPQFFSYRCLIYIYVRIYEARSHFMKRASGSQERMASQQEIPTRPFLKWHRAKAEF
jgi:hypothetical protein